MTARRGEMTLEEFLTNVEAGIIDDRLDAFVPPKLFGPPTATERAAAERRRARRRAAAARARQTNDPSKRISA